MAHGCPGPREEGASTAMVGCGVLFYGMQHSDKMLCSRRWAECVQQMSSHPHAVTGAGERFGQGHGTAACSPGRLQHIARKSRLSPETKQSLSQQH